MFESRLNIPTYRSSWNVINFLLPSRLFSHHFTLLPNSQNHGQWSSLLTPKLDFHRQVDLQCHAPFSLNPCSIVNVEKDDEDQSVKVPTVAAILTLRNVLSFPVVYRLLFKAPPDGTGRTPRRPKHSIDPRADETGFLPPNASRSVRGTFKASGVMPCDRSGSLLQSPETAGAENRMFRAALTEVWRCHGAFPRPLKEMI